MKSINVDSYIFSKLINGNDIYVDKTAYFHKMITSGGTLFFISRPRRFGKSMMISTLKSIFKGERELFKGLAIESLNYDWQTYPVIHFDFSGVDCISRERFEKSFRENVEDFLERAGFSYNRGDSFGKNFSDALKFFKKKYPQGVVVLIDEYDAPIGHALHKPELAESIRDELAQFYIQLKANIDCVRFLMVTGVSKFAQLSVFSALNNIVDLSTNVDYATMLGYTEEELEKYFDEHMRDHAAKMGKSYEEYREEFRYWYNGYRFSPDSKEKVYNPISVAKCLYEKRPIFDGTWTQTGRPSTLMNYIKINDLPEVDYEKIENVKASDISASELRNINPKGLLYQTGYLTIKDYDCTSNLYTLGVPDEEVREDLFQVIAGALSRTNVSAVLDIGVFLKTYSFDKFKECLTSYYAEMIYGAKENVQEASFQRCLLLALKACGFKCYAEVQQAQGRADVIAEHLLGYFIFELKVDDSAENAIAQIKEKGYAAPYVSKAEGKNIPIYAIGLSFSKEKRILLDCQVEKLL
ncbi:AAA family ATPase [bacterium]|nr:AAA family ATPase [bacterium]